MKNGGYKDLPPDVVRYVEINYPHNTHARIRDYLDDLGTPRVQRSVLYLANGSMSMFEHYAAEAVTDTREVIVEAEYETRISETPIPMRDMSKPFNHQDNLGKAMRKGPKRAAPKQITHHTELINERFMLGEARYVVMRKQPSASHVYLRRYKGTQTKVVRLPKIFVMEQVAETIELAS